MKIGDRTIGRDARPYLIAEMSGNHNQSLDRAFRIVNAAAAAGADAIKLQTYTADSMTLNVDSPDFVISDPNSLWAGRQLHSLYGEACTPWEWHKPIIERAKSLGMHCFSSPFDEKAVDFLMELDVVAFKIASFECTDLPLIRKVGKTGKPMIISTGMATLAEIDEAVSAAREAGARDIILLKCTSTYPSTPENSNVQSIPHLRAAFNTEVGLSDHTMGCGAAIAAVAFGATIIEKHFTLARSDGGVDSTFSLEPSEFQILRTESERAWQAIGGIKFGASEAEKKSLAFRRSVYISKDIAAGDTLNSDNMRIVRPGFGLAPKFFDVVVGRTVTRDLKAGTPLSWDLLK